MKIKNKAIVEGRELWKHLASFRDDPEPLKFPKLLPHCNSCAFRAGPHLANSSPMTQMDALKCGMEGYEFYCHQPEREGELCAGWAMVMLAKDKPDFVNVRRPFSEKVHDK